MVRWGIGDTRVEAVQRELQDRDEAMRQLREQLLKAQNRMKAQADTHRIDRSFEMEARYFGPYPVVERIWAVAYKLKLPEGSKIHPVFHVSLLKKTVGDYHEEADLSDQLEGEEPTPLEPERVLASRKVAETGQEMQQWLIQWAGKTPEEATWEDVVNMRSQFPTFNLEDKVNVSGGGVDENHVANHEVNDYLIFPKASGSKIWQVYSRRGKRGT
ncbi:hypothetical protein KIW84_070446 [Lathyrus oleraceus]|uniref:Chromo domain-containing protein n=1 Tax=Pisum sativum TaxID=3888 RepID=A0A9D4ZUH1_PEA|nr:hypothetical protein KIW84_070446 [Pisum sativum]